MRVNYWMLDSVIFACFLIAKHVGEDPDDPWHKYTQKNGRAQFQMDMADALIEYGIRLDCPDIRQLEDPDKRPVYMRKKDFVPCACGWCFFCRNGFTRGVMHPQFVLRSNVARAAMPPPPAQHDRERVNLIGEDGKPKKNAVICAVCMKRVKAEHPEWNYRRVQERMQTDPKGLSVLQKRKRSRSL